MRRALAAAKASLVGFAVVVSLARFKESIAAFNEGR